MQSLLSLAFLRLTLLENLLHDLLLLNQKRPDNPILDTIRTSRAAIGSLYGFLWAGDAGVFPGSESGDLDIQVKSARLQ